MSISETVDPVPPTGQRDDEKFDPVGDLGDTKDMSKSIHPVASNQSGHFTPPNVPSSDAVPELSSVDFDEKLDESSRTEPSGAESASIKTEHGILTPQYGPDLGNTVSNSMGPSNMYNVSQGPPHTREQQAHQQAPPSGAAPYAGNLESRGTTGMMASPSESEGQVFRPPFVVNLEMIKRTMDGVNRLLGVDLSDTEVSESALLEDPNKDLVNDEAKTNGISMEQKDPVVVAKGEYSHMRLICDACGHIVAAVGNAVLDAARESFEENLKLGTPNMRPKPPVRKKRGGILGFKELAARANLSPWHFHRVFRVTTGVTPKTYGEALWEYLMLQSGFNLDNEELTIDRNLNGKPGTGLSQGISPSSSSSPQSPSLVAPHYSPNSSSHSPPISSTATIGASGTSQPSTHTQTLTQNGGGTAPGTGRVRKARSRSRPSRSRSRTRSQTQSQVLTTLSAIGDTSVPDPGPRGRSFTRGIPSPVSGSLPQNMLSSPSINGSQGHPAPMPPPPPPQVGQDSVGPAAFDTDWFGPPEDLLSGLGGQQGGSQSHNVSLPHMGNQDLDAPDLTALSLQQLGLDPPSTGPVEIGGMRPRTDTSNWQIPTTMNPMGSPSGMASSAPDMSLLGSAYGNPVSRLERFKSPESIANGERNQNMNNAYSMHNFQAPPQGMYDDNAAMNNYVGSLNMNSFHRDPDYSLPRGMPMQQVGMNHGPVNYPHNQMSPRVNNFNEDVPSSAGSNSLESQIPNTPSLQHMREGMHENLQPNYRGSMHENLQDNFQDNLQQEMYQQQHQQQQGDGLGGLGDLPTSYYLGSKDSPKYDMGSKQDDDDFVSALIGDDPPMLPSWNEADENHAQDYGF